MNMKEKYKISPITVYDEWNEMWETKIALNDEAQTLVMSVWGKTKNESRSLANEKASINMINALDLERIPFRKIMGIYFLFKNDSLCYVGKSNNIMNRVSSHYDKEFGEYCFIECYNESELKEMEEYFIKKYQPSLNYNLTDQYFLSTYGGERLIIYDKITKEEASYTIYKAMEKYPFLNRNKMGSILTKKRMGKPLNNPEYEDEFVSIT